jgi:ATP-binding cassette subfamily C (CFTR/MRP) protein 4
MYECVQSDDREERAHGAVGWKMFSAYFSAAGNCCYVFVILSLFFWCQLFASAGDYWITVWYVKAVNRIVRLLQFCQKNDKFL